MSHKKSKKINIQSIISYYPDTELDIAGYEFQVWKAGIIIAAFIMVLLDLVLLFGIPVRITLLSLAMVVSIALPLNNLLINIKKGRILSDSLLIFISGIIIFAVGDYRAAAIVVLAYDVMRLFESYLSEMQQSKAADLLDILPDEAIVIVDGVVEKRKPSRILKGDFLGVRALGVIPVDGDIVQGVSSVDYSKLTGAKKDIAVSKGSHVLSGGFNLTQDIIIRASCDYSDSVAQKVFSACSNSVKTETEESARLKKIFAFYVPLMLLLSAVFGLAVPAFSHNWEIAAKRAAAFLILGCGFGLYNSISLSILTTIENIFASGAIIRESSVLNLINDCSTFVCNKTGTLTEKEFEIEDINPVGLNINNFLSLVSKVESVSNHPIARSLRRYLGVEDIEVPEGIEYEELAGKGIKALVSGNAIIVGNASLLDEYGIQYETPNWHGTVVYVAANGNYCGYITLLNRVRRGSADAMEGIKSQGIVNLALLSCDLLSSVRTIGQSLGFNVVKAEISPSEKINSVDYLMGNRVGKETVIYLGNGTDEKEPSLQSDVSVACDAFENSQALDFADVSMLGEGISGFPEIIRCAKNCVLLSKIDVVSNAVLRLIFIFLALAGKLPLGIISIILACLSIAAFLFASVLFDRI